jgi:hypothetical protein
MTMTCTRTSSTPELIGAEPSLGARSRTAYGHRDWSPMRVRSSFRHRDDGRSTEYDRMMPQSAR